MPIPFFHRSRRSRHGRSIGSIVLLLAVLLGCGFHPSSIEAYAMPAVIIEKGGEDREYQVRRGDEVVLRLPENPTSGYRWEVDYRDDAILGPPDSHFSIHGGQAIGAGGVRTFTFEARAPGSSPLRMSLKRSWESPPQSIDHFEITVQVHEKKQP